MRQTVAGMERRMFTFQRRVERRAYRSGDLLPAAHQSIWHEDFADSFVQLANSTDLVVITIISGIALMVYNTVGNMVSAWPL